MILKHLLFILISLFLTFSLSASEHGSGDETFNLAGVIEHHLMDQVIFPLQVTFPIIGVVDMGITKRVTMMWIASLLMIFTFIPAARIISKNPYKVGNRFAGSVESILEFLQKDVIDKNMHGHGHPFYHYLFSLFFFILYCNLLGIVPPIGSILALGDDHALIAQVWSGITVTGDVAVTLSLASLTLLLMYATGFIYQGPKFIVNVVPNGVPLALYPLLWPLELVVSPFAKAFALTIRLLANMTAGHVVILALLGFIFQFQSYWVALASVPGATAIYLLEIFVAFLQSFIFTLLTSLFVGSMMHRH